MDTCASLLSAVRHCKEVLDEQSWDKYQDLQKHICRNRQEQIAFMEQMESKPVSSSTSELIQFSLTAIQALQALELESCNLEQVTADARCVSVDPCVADVFMRSCRAFATLQIRVLSLLQTAAALNCTCKAMLQATLDPGTLNTTAPQKQLDPRASTLIPLTIYVTHREVVKRRQGHFIQSPARLMSPRHQEHLATPGGLMSKHGWKQWRQRIQLDLQQRYPRARATVCLQPFGDRVFHRCNPAGRRNVIVIWDSLEIVAYVTYPFNVFGANQLADCCTDRA